MRRIAYNTVYALSFVGFACILFLTVGRVAWYFFKGLYANLVLDEEQEEYEFDAFLEGFDEGRLRLLEYIDEERANEERRRQKMGL